MSWLFDNNHAISPLTEYWDFNSLPYERVDLWNECLDVYGRYDITEKLGAESGQVLCVSLDVFIKLLNWPQSNYSVRNFLQKNTIVAYSEIDAFVHCDFNSDLLNALDKSLTRPCVHILIDARPSDHHWSKNLKNISFLPIEKNWCIQMPRILGSHTHKYSNAKDFLLTTIKKRSRPHRQILWNQLKKHNGLLDRGIVHFNVPGADRIGLQPHQHDWNDGYPSMDLYRNCWLEVVPETLYKSAYFITEKTIKPIATKTPFLILSSQGYLKFIKDQGFLTFDSLIDESYDQCHRVEDRAKNLVLQLQDIVQNGAREFYEAAYPILEYNQNHLMQLVGAKTFYFDQVMADLIETVDQKSQN